jgi:hypothetical protein
VIVGKRPEQVNTVTGEIEPADEDMRQAELIADAVERAVRKSAPVRVFGEHDSAANEQAGKPDFETWRAEALGSSA